MRKSAVVMPILVVIAGLFGFLIRTMEVNTVFDAVTGLAKRGSTVTVILIGLSILTAAGILVFSIITSNRYKSEPEYTLAFAPRGFLYLGVSFALAIAWLVAAVWYFVSQRASAATDIVNMPGTGALSVIDLIFTVLAALSAISLIMLARRAYKGSSGSDMLVFGVIPSIFFCFWLIVLYKNNAANPVLLSYCYQVLAIAAAALSYYFGAGFIFGKAVTGKATASYLLTIFLCVVVLADNVGLPIKIMFGVTAVNMLLNAVVFLRNLKRRGF